MQQSAADADVPEVASDTSAYFSRNRTVRNTTQTDRHLGLEPRRSPQRKNVVRRPCRKRNTGSLQVLGPGRRYHTDTPHDFR